MSGGELVGGGVIGSGGALCAVCVEVVKIVSEAR